MFSIDWDAVRNLLPVYAYEYEVEGEISTTTSYWYPHQNKGQQPPPGWTHIDRDDSHPEMWREAVDLWIKTVVRPNEKAVWYDTATGDFSDTFRLGDLDAAFNSKEELESHSSNWRLIVYRSAGADDFEFSNMMRIVTKPREARR